MNRFDFYTPHEICTQFGSRLKQQRLLKQLTQEELANNANLGVSTVQRFEQAKGGTFENFIRLVIALGLIRDLESLLLPVKNNLDDVIKIQEIKQRQRASKRSRS